MLERVAEDPTRVVCPIIDVISMDNFQVSILLNFQDFVANILGK